MARVALVTGGTRGIGKAIVQRLKEDGMAVAAGYSGNDEAAAATASAVAVGSGRRAILTLTVQIMRRLVGCRRGGFWAGCV